MPERICELTPRQCQYYCEAIWRRQAERMGRLSIAVRMALAEGDDFQSYLDSLRGVDGDSSPESRFPSYMTVEYHPELAEANESE